VEAVDEQITKYNFLKDLLDFDNLEVTSDQTRRDLFQEHPL
jgi:hypothetical protein